MVALVRDLLRYLLASRRHGTLHVGVTNDLSRRVYEHKTKIIKGFTAKYSVDRLVWYEAYWKIRLIEEMNPDWDDLYVVLNR